jgi:outer membrane protein
LAAVFILVAWASLAQSADISVRMQGGPANGVLVFQIYDSPNTFGDFRDPVKETRAPWVDDALTTTDR